MHAGQTLTSPTGAAKLVFQEDGNLVVRPRATHVFLPVYRQLSVPRVPDDATNKHQQCLALLASVEGKAPHGGTRCT